MSLFIPQPPVISNVTAQGFQVTVVPDGNPIGTFYSYQVIFSGTGGFINPQGIVQPVQTWLNTTMIKVINATPGTNYSVRLMAADDNIGTNSTAWGTTTNFTTLTGVNSQDSSQFSPAEQQVIQHVRCLLPEVFSRNTRDAKILCYAGVVLADINLFPPFTAFTFDDIVNQPSLASLFYFGITVLTDMFMQMRAGLEDFQYNDNGLSLNVDQVDKLNSSIQNMLQFYRTMVINFKKTQIFVVGAAGLGTPRYQSQIGQFLKIALGSAFTWNSP